MAGGNNQLFWYSTVQAGHCSAMPRVLSASDPPFWTCKRSRLRYNQCRPRRVRLNGSTNRIRAGSENRKEPRQSFVQCLFGAVQICGRITRNATPAVSDLKNCSGAATRGCIARPVEAAQIVFINVGKIFGGNAFRQSWRLNNKGKGLSGIVSNCIFVHNLLRPNVDGQGSSPALYQSHSNAK